jgi:hypothetical protein
MTLILDAGALLAVERQDRDLIALVKGELRLGRAPVTHGGVIGQVWRGGARQARLAAFLHGVHVAPVDDDLGRRSGVLLARARRSDVIDAAVVLLAEDGDSIFTSDPNDLRRLAESAGVHVDLVAV